MDVSMSDNSQDHSQNPDDQNNTQPLSQHSDVTRPEDDLDAKCWGLLLPCTPGRERVRFPKANNRITVGRDAKNTVVITWMAVSSLHAIIRWNGQEDGQSIVTIEDCSSNGTFLKGERIGKGNTRVLTDGCEISFGPASRHSKEHMPEYRYTYRDLVSEKRDLYRKYDLSIELGHGSYARVYKALQKGTSKWVAVKVISQTMRFNMSPDREAGAIREITVMRTLRHPNICAFLDYFENPDKSIDIVLEYMDGGDLGTYMMRTNNGQGIGEWLSCHFTYQICKAVTYIHSCKITHRDLKPENILLSPDDPPIAKIADFGLAKLVDDATVLKTICGTRSYMAPEIITRLSTDSPYTNLVDSWSIGAIVFSMFTMQTPFPKLPTLEVKALVTNQLIDWVHLDEKEDISDNGKDFVRQLLVFDPDNRTSLVEAQLHPWLVGHKPTYEIQTPDELDAGQTVTRTVSLNSGASNSAEPPPRPTLPRAATVDPYADDHPQPPPVRNGPKLRTPSPVPLDPIAEVESRVPGLSLVPSQSTPPQSASVRRVTTGRVFLQPADNGLRPLDPSAKALGYVQESTDDILYAPAPMQDLPHPGPAAPEGAAQKRTFAEMQIDGSSPLSSPPSSIASSPPPRKKPNKGRVAKKSTGGQSKPDALASTSTRQRTNTRNAKGKKKAESDVEKPPAVRTTTVRRSSRPARPPKP